MAKKIEKKERVEILAERVRLLFGFTADLIKDKDLVREVLQLSKDRREFSLSAAPILGAFGMDYEIEEFEAGLREKRARALLNLIEVLEQTENDRVAFAEKQRKIKAGRDQLRGILGH